MCFGFKSKEFLLCCSYGTNTLRTQRSGESSWCTTRLRCGTRTVKFTSWTLAAASLKSPPRTSRSSSEGNRYDWPTTFHSLCPPFKFWLVDISSDFQNWLGLHWKLYSHNGGGGLASCKMPGHLEVGANAQNKCPGNLLGHLTNKKYWLYNAHR